MGKTDRRDTVTSHNRRLRRELGELMRELMMREEPIEMSVGISLFLLCTARTLFPSLPLFFQPINRTLSVRHSAKILHVGVHWLHCLAD
jgi:hypothetical protein